ncbi:MAG TPA: type II toxin-antitoxin system Phd/YefM family antitoxin [Nitrospiria bacterium]|nr:type II toxin-antitoxin system Phd/YefM family antitoxin [Nitrospiria bacterium]
MSKTIRATEAVRQFSDLLNTIRFRGESFTVTRGGKPIAYMGPVEEVQKSLTMGELKRVLQNLPHLGEEAESFWEDIKDAARHQPSLPKE